MKLALAVFTLACASATKLRFQDKINTQPGLLWGSTSTTPHECAIVKVEGKYELETKCEIKSPVNDKIQKELALKADKTYCDAKFDDLEKRKADHLLHTKRLNELEDKLTDNAVIDKMNLMIKTIARQNNYCGVRLSKAKTNAAFYDSISATGLLPAGDDLEKRELDRELWATCKPGYWDPKKDTNEIVFTCLDDGNWKRDGANCERIQCPASAECTSATCGVGSVPHSDGVLHPPLPTEESTVSTERGVTCKAGHGYGGDSAFHGSAVTMLCVQWRPFMKDSAGRDIAGKPGQALWYHDTHDSDHHLNRCTEYVCKQTGMSYQGWKGSMTQLNFPALVQQGKSQVVDCDPNNKNSHDGSVTRSCDIKGLSHFSGTCSQKNCAALSAYTVQHPDPNYRDSFSISTGDLMHSQSNAVSCYSANSQFTVGTITMTCNAKTHSKWANNNEDDWTIDTSQCKKQCAASELTAYSVSGVSTADCNNKLGGQSCTIKCNSGSKTTTAHCGYNGKWTTNPTAPRCAFGFKFSHMSNGGRHGNKVTDYYEAHSVGTAGVSYPSSGGAGQCQRSNYGWGGSYYGTPSGSYSQTAHGNWNGDNVDYLSARVVGNRIDFHLRHYHQSTGYFTGAYGVQAKCWLFKDNSQQNSFLGHKYGGHWGSIRRDQDFSHTFGSAGTYYVRCGIHDLAGCRQGFDNNPGFSCANANSGCGWDHHYDNVQMKIEIG